MIVIKNPHSNSSDLLWTDSFFCISYKLEEQNSRCRVTTSLLQISLAELIMVVIIIVFIFIIIKYSAVENIWVLDHLYQGQTPILICISLQKFRVETSLVSKLTVSFGMESFHTKVRALWRYHNVSFEPFRL